MHNKQKKNHCGTNLINQYNLTASEYLSLSDAQEI